MELKGITAEQIFSCLGSDINGNINVIIAISAFIIIIIIIFLC